MLGSILFDWLIYKNRGVAQSDANEDEQVVIANPEDASAHRVRDLGKTDKDK